MKAMTCEMCGSTNLVKQDGVYVCENCGTKYSVEEAKKLLVEVSGTVKIDDTDELKKLYQVARTARNNRNNELASTYYSSILVKDPLSWEATFYSFVCSAYTKTKGEVLSILPTLQGTTATAGDLICDSDMTEDEKYTALFEVATNTCSLTETLALAQYERNCLNNHTSTQDDLLVVQAFSAPAIALSNVIDAKCEKSERFEQLMIALRFTVSSVGAHKSTAFISPDFAKLAGGTAPNGGLNVGLSLAKEGKKPIAKGDGTYEMPGKLVGSLGNNGTIELGYAETTNSGAGGCYVATCVYGSYDCPQVWTLRRFRDDDLAVTWYGRLFIHTYYAISPTIVKLFGNTDWFKRMWRGKLDKMVAELQKKGYEATPYEDKNW